MSQIKDILVEDVIRLCNGNLICGKLDTPLIDFCKDTREIKEGDVYAGVKGENHDGNIYYEEALKNGASVCILQGVTIPKDVIEQYKDKSIIIVEDTIRALQELAAYKREMYDIPVVAITGSVGKTSTKDIVASVMAKQYNVLKTEGNYNSQLGLALTVLRLKNHNAMVVEMGMNHLGEISRLSKIAKPTVAIITNVGTAHIGLLGSRENILKAKLEILEGLKEDGIVIINNDNDLLYDWNLKFGSQYKVITYGMENESAIIAHDTILSEEGSTYTVEIEKKTYPVNVGIGGNHFVLNSLCAISVGHYFNIPMNKILEGIANFELTKRRMQTEKLKNQVTIINDCYNANYDSMKAAIEYLGKLPTKRKIAVLGDMLELGEYSEDLHRKVGREVARSHIDILITVGTEAKYIADEAQKNGMLDTNIYTFDKNEEAENKIKEFMKSGNVDILIKASNGMKFQGIFEKLIEMEQKNS